MADGEEEEEAHDWRRSRAASPSARGSRRSVVWQYLLSTCQQGVQRCSSDLDALRKHPSLKISVQVSGSTHDLDIHISLSISISLFYHANIAMNPAVKTKGS
uniref:Uncharacterized protein n=1 Tax=Oryza barthii TaxID=65489 RepID=A0A0D3GI15_9ORYZ